MPSPAAARRSSQPRTPVVSPMLSNSTPAMSRSRSHAGRSRPAKRQRMSRPGSPARRLPPHVASKRAVLSWVANTSPTRRWAMRDDHSDNHATRTSSSQQTPALPSSDHSAKIETLACVNGVPYRVRSRPVPVASSKPSPSTPPEGKLYTEAPEYEVGYGKPPKSTQFQKGQSGNRSEER